jgi:hypothetical protein
LSTHLRALAVGLVLCSAWFGGCAPTTTELTVKSTAAPMGAGRAQPRPGGAQAPAAPAVAGAGVRVHVVEVQDARLDPESIGHVANRAFVARGLAKQLDRSLRASIHGRWPTAEKADGGELVVAAKLHKCYVSNIDVTKAAVVVVEVAYQHQGQEAGSRIYRGTFTGMNWWGSDAEFAGALQVAFDQCIAQVIRDVEARAQLIASRNGS